MKVVINRCFGGYSLSLKARIRYLEIKGIPYQLVELEEPTLFDRETMKIILTGDNEGKSTYWFFSEVERNDPALVQVVEELGQEAGGFAANLEVIEIPDDVEWEIKEYDGNEWVAEKHRTWG